MAFDINVASGDTIVVNPITRVRKPVIYLYPPFSLPDVTVELSLVSSWSFSAVYPPPRTTDSPPNERRAGQAGQSLTWTIAAEPDGTLLDKSSGLEVSYLYWEATATSSSRLLTPVVSRAATPIEGNRDTETFDPSRPSVNPDDSILLHTSKVPGYLDTALKALALNTEARTSFITFWLPDLVKHEYVALRFIAQESYEKAARMRISPVPDVVTRVFMLARADNATFWAGVVGVNVARASDRGLFRVLEWGGMEVK
ncbi:hypothetical protein B0F90DRAFT_1810951 [Multifurca ochricompacta]|uniref:Uncharacterized protein n=1 Tax=Multifurca ochricompacta TaxID=376703 RepID=A0AAD4M187_9AGAM|nr:hypothetical protein B0F90DRAFT_1810951 [Multifurca ochricompacta]